MTITELEKLEALLTDWIVELEGRNRPTMVHKAREVKKSVQVEIEEVMRAL